MNKREELQKVATDVFLELVAVETAQLNIRLQDSALKKVVREGLHERNDDLQQQLAAIAAQLNN